MMGGGRGEGGGGGEGGMMKSRLAAWCVIQAKHNMDVHVHGLNTSLWVSRQNSPADSSDWFLR